MIRCQSKIRTKIFNCYWKSNWLARTIWERWISVVWFYQPFKILIFHIFIDNFSNGLSIVKVSKPHFSSMQYFPSKTIRHRIFDLTFIQTLNFGGGYVSFVNSPNPIYLLFEVCSWVSYFARRYNFDHLERTRIERTHGFVIKIECRQFCLIIANHLEQTGKKRIAFFWGQWENWGVTMLHVFDQVVARVSHFRFRKPLLANQILYLRGLAHDGY